MTEDEIGPLCQKLLDGLRADADVAPVAVTLLQGFLTDVNRLAWFAEQLVRLKERDSS